jgi:hypothetical protein
MQGKITFFQEGFGLQFRTRGYKMADSKGYEEADYIDIFPESRTVVVCNGPDRYTFCGIPFYFVQAVSNDGTNT